MPEPERFDTLARAAADEVRSGMTVGLGTGSTASAVIRELGRRVANGLAIRGVSTSSRTSQLAEELGIPLITLDEVEGLDLGIDGADEVDPSLDVIKGRGGALLHEKLVALCCADYLIVASSEKQVPRFGSRAGLPVEVVPFGWQHTVRRLTSLGLRPQRRTVESNGAPYDERIPFVSDGGHFVLDCALDSIRDATTLANAIKATPGVVEHGLFLGLAKQIFLADEDGSVRRLIRGQQGATQG